MSLPTWTIDTGKALGVLTAARSLLDAAVEGDPPTLHAALECVEDLVPVFQRANGTVPGEWDGARFAEWLRGETFRPIRVSARADGRAVICDGSSALLCSERMDTEAARIYAGPEPIFGDEGPIRTVEEIALGPAFALPLPDLVALAERARLWETAAPARVVIQPTGDGAVFDACRLRAWVIAPALMSGDDRVDVVPAGPGDVWWWHGSDWSAAVMPMVLNHAPNKVLANVPDLRLDGGAS